MLQLTAGQSNEKIIVTLNELKTLTGPYYLFRFVHVGTGEVVSLLRSALTDDESIYQGRYNKFNIDTVTVFLDKPPGEWHYTIYEQVSSSNTDPDLATGVVEYGKMYLLPAVEYAPKKYESSPRTFKMYQGAAAVGIGMMIIGSTNIIA